MKYEHQLRKLSSEERKNLSSEEIFHSAEFSSYLQKMGETLLRHCGITKRLSLTILPTGIAPGWTDGKKEYLVPENTITEAYNDIYAKFTALLGIHFHEIAHIIYCDFAEEQKAIDKIKAGEFYGELPVPKTQAEVDASNTQRRGFLPPPRKNEERSLLGWATINSALTSERLSNCLA